MVIDRQTPSNFGDVLSSEEQYYMGWFRARSMFKLPGAFISPFWKVVLMQSSVTEPAVRHAVLALSSFHCASVLGTDASKSPMQNKITLEQYNNAITSLCTQFSTADAESVRTVVIACIVFVFLDYLRGRYQTAKAHLEHGVRLWKELQSKQLSSRQAVTYVDDWVSQTLTSLQLQSVMFGQFFALSAETFPFQQRKFENFSSVNEAKAALDCILLDLYRFRAKEPTRPQTYKCVHPLWYEFQEDLSNWLSLLVRFSTLSELDALGQVACRLLKIYHIMGKILLEMCRDSSDHNVLENHTSDFMFIIEQGVDMYKIAAKQNWHDLKEPGKAKASRGIADIGTIPPLYFTALECRDDKLRVEAIRLLGCLAHKEGIWDAELAAAIAKKVIQLENDPRRGSTETERTSGCDQGLSQIRHVEVVLPDDPDGLVTLQYFQTGISGLDEVTVAKFDLRSQQWLSV